MFHDEPTIVPDGEMPCLGCSHTDCLDCGREVRRAMLIAATSGTAGVIELALEVVHQTEQHGKDIPAHAFTLGTLAKFSGMQRPLDKAWADGICEALTDTADMGDTYQTVDESEAYQTGVALVAWWREDERRKRDVKAAKTTVDAWAAMGVPSPITPSEFAPCTLAEKARRLGIAYAAGSQEPPSTPPASRGHARDAGPGRESRAQHRAESGNASRGLHSPQTASRRGG
jgi:hypothetical protein